MYREKAVARARSLELRVDPPGSVGLDPVEAAWTARELKEPASVAGDLEQNPVEVMEPAIVEFGFEQQAPEQGSWNPVPGAEPRL